MSIPNDAFKTLIAPWKEVIETISKDEDLEKRVKTLLSITDTALTTLRYLQKCSAFPPSSGPQDDLSNLLKKIDFEIAALLKNKESLKILSNLLTSNADVKLQQTFTKIDRDNYENVKDYIDCANLVFSALEKRSSTSDKAKRNISLIKENKEKILRLQKTMLAANASLQQLSTTLPTATPVPLGPPALPSSSAPLPTTGFIRNPPPPLPTTGFTRSPPPVVTSGPSPTLSAPEIKSGPVAPPPISESVANSKMAVSDLLAMANAKMNKIHQAYPAGSIVKDLAQAVEVFKQCDEMARLFFRAGKELEGAQAKNFALDILQGPASHPEHAEWKSKLASEIFAKMSREIAENPDLFTSVHSMYDEAAHDYLKENNIKAATAIRVLAASKFRPTETHPLHNVQKAMETMLTAMETKDRRLGAHFSHLGGGTINSGLVRIEDRKIENEYFVKTCIDFNLTRPARKQLQKFLNKIYVSRGTIMDAKSKAQIDENRNVFCKELSRIFRGRVLIRNIEPILRGCQDGIYKVLTGYRLNYFTQLPEAIEIEFEGVGKIIIHNNPSCGTFYNHITLELDGPASNSSETMRDAQNILSVLGLGPICGVRPSEEELRLKVSVLYRSHFPQQMTKLQEDLGSKYFEMPVAELMQTIQTTTDAMKDIFNNTLGTMKKRNIYPGREVWVDPDIVARVKRAGAWGFIQGLGKGNIKDKHELVRDFMKLAINLKLGPLSSSERIYSTISVSEGSSTNSDFDTGGGDQVFVRAITKQVADNPLHLFNFSGSCQVIYSPRLAERIGYAFPSDCWGVRNPTDTTYGLYRQRQPLDALVSSLIKTDSSNEAMVKENIDMSEYLLALMVQNKETKDIMRAVFLEVGILKINENGEEIVYIGDGKRTILFDDLVHISDGYKKDIFKEKEDA